jgi:hypothetical protein
LLILADGEDAIFDRDIFTGQDKIDAGVGGGAGDVDTANARVRVRGTQELAVGHAGKGNVVGEASLAGDFGARVNAAAGVADYTEIAIVSVGLFRWRIFLLRHRRS